MWKPCKPNYFSLLPMYKFHLAFENAICEHYIKEKHTEIHSLMK